MTETSGKKKTVRVEDALWRTGLALLLVAGAAAGLSAAGVLPLARLIHPCLLRQTTGFYCPGCGGTRAFLCLLRGDILGSLYYHPAVPYMAGLFLAFMGSQAASRLSGGKIRGMRYRGIYGVIAVVLVILSFVIKNAALLMGAARW